VLKRDIFLNMSLAAEMDDLIPLLQQDTQHDRMQYTIQRLPVLASYGYRVRARDAPVRVMRHPHQKQST
jgi:hypothetical protein